MLTTFPLKRQMHVGDLLAVADGPNSRKDVLNWLTRAPRRVKLNEHALRICTLPVDAHRSITTLRMGTL